jgi:hypothetical protein
MAWIGGETVSKKLTPWFLMETKPAYVGVYQINLSVGVVKDVYFSHWNGKQWSWFSRTVQDLIKSGYSKKSGRKHDCLFIWRGLARKPS